MPDGQNCYHNPFPQTRWESDRRARTEVILDGETTGKQASSLMKATQHDVYGGLWNILQTDFAK